jgi:hypothetical protein
MRPNIAHLLIAVLALPALPSALAQDTKDAQNKLLAKRAAEADAYRKLGETIKGFQITSETFVQDFVTEADIIQTELDTFIRGVRLGDPKWYDDLSCEVPGEVTLEQVITELKAMHTRHYKGDRITATDIEKMNQYVKRDVIKVVGMGAPRPDLPPGLPEGLEEQLSQGITLPPPVLPDLWRQMGPQARLMAKRAAEVDAQRRLAERIKGIRITSDTLVRDFVTESDVINTVCQTTLRGAREVRTYYHHDEPICEVTMAVPLEQVITTIKEIHTRYYKGDTVKATDITQLNQRINNQTFEATGMGVPPSRAIAKAEAVMKIDIPDWATAPVRATGSGTDNAIDTPQGKLKAARAAELDAKRKLAEQIAGLRINSDTLVRDFVTENDQIQTQVDAVLVGSYVEKTDFPGDGTAQVMVTVPGMQVWKVVHEYLVIRTR